MRFLARIALVATLSLSACSSPSVDVPSASEEVTDIPETAIKRQRVGNCWIFTAVAWIESLAKDSPPRGAKMTNASEAYLTYFSWADAIHDGRTDVDDLGRPVIVTSGYVSQALELVRRYGLMSESDFGVTTEETKAARALVEAELAPGGALDTPKKRADRVAVRRVLDRAFGLTPAVKAAITRAFGEGLDGELAQGDMPKTIVPAAAIVVGRDGERDVTLADAIGTPIRGDEFARHRGELAWEEIVVGDDEPVAATQRRMKASLNQRFPVPLSWAVDYDYRSEDDGSFGPQRVKQTDDALRMHASLIDDYEIVLANGKVLPVGKVETRPEMLAATLDSGAQVRFVRVKNSWGYVSKKGVPQGGPDARGYIDLYWGYLFSKGHRRAVRMLLPPASWAHVTRP